MRLEAASWLVSFLIVIFILLLIPFPKALRLELDGEIKITMKIKN